MPKAVFDLVLSGILPGTVLDWWWERAGQLSGKGVAVLTARPPPTPTCRTLGRGGAASAGRGGAGRHPPTLLPSYPRGLQPGTSLRSGSLGKAAVPCWEWEPGL